MSDLLKFFLPCPMSVLLLPVAWPAAECPVCFLLRLVARIPIFLLQLMFVCCWKLQLCFLMQCTEGSPALFWSKTSKLPMQTGYSAPSSSTTQCNGHGQLGSDQHFLVLTTSPSSSPHSRSSWMAGCRLSYDVDPCQGWIPDGHLPTAGLRACFTQDWWGVNDATISAKLLRRAGLGMGRARFLIKTWCKIETSTCSAARGATDTPKRGKWRWIPVR